MDPKLLPKADSISRFKKEKFLLGMTEDEFRDNVVRPLFLRQGLKRGDDLCGPTELGKDVLFVSVDALGFEDIYVVQTKRGPLNMSGKVSSNLISAITQLKTALETSVPIIASKCKKYPAKAFLCASGKVNSNARSHISESVRDPRVVIIDSDDIIPKIDTILPELWLGIDADLFPYLRAVKRIVEHPSEDHAISDIVAQGSVLDAASDSMYVDLRAHRTSTRLVNKGGEMTKVDHFEDIAVSVLVSRKERLIVLFGDAGGGKSTTMKRLAYILAKRGLESSTSYKIPVLIRATELFDHAKLSLLELCIASTKAVIDSSKQSFTSDDLTNGRLVILVDALDELARNDAREHVLNRILEFANIYPKCQVILSSREYAFIREMNALAHFTDFRLDAINYRQVEQILQRFEKKSRLSPEKSKEILRQLQEIHGMQLNPLLVTVFAATSDYSRRDIPANITELFKKFTEMMLGRWDAAKGVAQQYQAPLKDFVIAKIAFEMHRRHLTSLNVDEFTEMVSVELAARGHKADVKQLVEEILNRSGLFRVAGNVVEFRHHLLQEFFAGRGIQNKQNIETYIADEWWQRAIVFYFGEHPEDAETFKNVITSFRNKTEGEAYLAALTVGLALQACYLMKTDEKLKLLPWVFNSVARGKDHFVHSVDQYQDKPLMGFLAYYLTARECVASKILSEHLSEISSEIMKQADSKDAADIREFWLIVGLMESGDIEAIKSMVKQFRPTDLRLLLALHLGCFVLQHLRVATKEERKIAAEVTKYLAEKVQPLRERLLKELKSELLEMRKGKIEVIERAPTEELLIDTPGTEHS